MFRLYKKLHLDFKLIKTNFSDALYHVEKRCLQNLVMYVTKLLEGSAHIKNAPIFIILR